MSHELTMCTKDEPNFGARVHPDAEEVPDSQSWHIDVMSEHLEAVSRGEITRLCINVPTGTMKSLLVSVFLQAWEWGPLNRPHLRYLSTSHREDFAKRDTRRTRKLVLSDWYRTLYPHVNLMEARAAESGEALKRRMISQTGVGRVTPLVTQIVTQIWVGPVPVGA